MTNQSQYVLINEKKLQLNQARLNLYEELNPRGKAFVDRLALSIRAGVETRREQVGDAPDNIMGEQTYRLMALAFLQNYWTGKLPEA